MAEHRAYSDDLKAKVLADWTLGATYGELAKKYNVPRSSIQRWTATHERTATIQQPDLFEAFSMSVYDRTMEALDALSVHLRAAQGVEFAGTLEGWTERTASLSRTIVTLGGAIQRGSPQYAGDQLTDGIHTP